MCHIISKVYACGHTKANWYNCHIPDADPNPLGSVTSLNCELCDLGSPALATIQGWDTCMICALQRTQGHWACCVCSTINDHKTPSCKGKVTSAARDVGTSWACQHRICAKCLAVDAQRQTQDTGHRTRVKPVVTPGHIEPGCSDKTCDKTMSLVIGKRKRAGDDEGRTEEAKIRYLGPGWHREIDPGFYLCFTDSEDEDD